MLGKFDSEKEESNFIAAEIKRCVANMGGILKWGDFVVLREFTSAHIIHCQLMGHPSSI